MNIPFKRKENPNDCGCAPVCLQMALEYYGNSKPIDEVYELCESIGNTHYTLPWGMLLGAAKSGLYAWFISKNPWELLPESRQDVGNITGYSTDDIKNIEIDQVRRCEDSNLIRIIKWNNRIHKSEPKFHVSNKNAIVIPTVWWGVQPHNIVLVDWDSCDQQNLADVPKGCKYVYYHDPNGEANSKMTEKDFFQMWLHPYTDNDLLIISKDYLYIPERRAAARAARPIISEHGEIIWENIFFHFLIPLTNLESSNEQNKKWAYQILEEIKEEDYNVPLESTPDPEDDKILSTIIAKYHVDNKSSWVEIDLLKKISENLDIANNDEIFFLLYRLIEK